MDLSGSSLASNDDNVSVAVKLLVDPKQYGRAVVRNEWSATATPHKIVRKEEEIKTKGNSKHHEFPQASTWVLFSKRYSPSLLLLCTRKIGVISQKAHLGNNKQPHRRCRNLS